MTINLGRFNKITIDPKTSLGKLEEVMEIGNLIRRAKGLRLKSLDTYLQNRPTWELILKTYNSNKRLAETEIMSDLPTYSNGDIIYSKVAESKVFDEVFKINTKGKIVNRGTWANAIIVLDLAQWLDIDLKIDLYKAYLNTKVLTKVSKLEKELKSQIKAQLVDGRDEVRVMEDMASVGLFRDPYYMVQTLINERLADVSNEMVRAEVIKKLTTVLEYGLVKTFAEFADIISKTKI